MSRRKLFNPSTKLQPRPATEPVAQGGEGQVKSQFTVQQTLQARSGPLPDPETLKEYEQIMPKAADRIFSLAEREQNFAHNYNFNEQKARAFATMLGQIFGFILGLVGITGAVVLSVYGKEFGGIVLFLGSVGTLIGTAVWGKNVPAKKTSPEKKS